MEKTLPAMDGNCFINIANLIFFVIVMLDLSSKMFE